ncbi:DUF1501 domain-containing protein [Pilimelia columellifera]|uniref:DUF1501 domain-containing protein n=1 Tax=Pilimelia columellifera subsp. columellifera TaxID=706583 RepID=A0ABN3NPX1_9ACTN
MTTPCGCPEHERATGMTRRGLLGRALAVGAAGAFGGLAADTLSTSLAFADSGYQGDVLVVLSLRGGFDGLNVVVPHGDPNYYLARPQIGVPRSMLLGADVMFGLHPAMAPLLPFWQAGTLGAVHAVGQPNPTRSHFQAMEEMERAAAGTSLRTGWLDRMLGVNGATSPFNGVAVGSAMTPRAFAGPTPDLSVRSLDDFALSGEAAGRPMAATLRALYDDAPPAMATPAAAVDSALATTAALRSAGYTPANGAVYPDSELGAALRDVARLVKAKVGLMAATVDFGDWDFHENIGTPVKGQRLHDHLADVAAALAAFAADLGPTGLAGVTLLTLSEFGRRVAENGSRGADHGHGNAMLLLGGGVRGGRVHGRWPGLAPAQLVGGDLAGTTDYRAVIAEILQRRCGLGDINAVFPGVTAAGLGLVTPLSGRAGVGPTMSTTLPTPTG